jgi:NADPH:quinone reductase-like Zn-dependent oxidoreductase
MRAVRIDRFGGPEVIQVVEIAVPAPLAGQVAVRVRAAGVGPWDALVRSGQSALVAAERLPLTLGADFAGVIDSVGTGVTAFAPGDEVYGATNDAFIGAHAEVAIAMVGKIARKPRRLDFVAAASVPVVAVTAWQMLFEHARVAAGQTVLVLSASGGVGSFAVALAHQHGARVLATTSAAEAARVRALGAERVFDALDPGLAREAGPVDVVLDMAGGPAQTNGASCLRRGGVFVSVVGPLDPARAQEAGVRAANFIVDVSTRCLIELAQTIDAGHLDARVGTVLPLRDAGLAHDMLAGRRPHAHGKIVLAVDA